MKLHYYLQRSRAVIWPLSSLKWYLRPLYVSVLFLYALIQSELIYATRHQLIQPINTTASANRVVTMFWCDKYLEHKNCTDRTNTALPVSTVNEDPNVSPVTLNLGYFFINYNFIVPINSNVSINQFWFSVDDKNGTAPTVYNNEGEYYIVDQDQVFFAPMMSHMDIVMNGTSGGYGNTSSTYTRVYTLVAAVRIHIFSSSGRANKPLGS